ncbi:MAG: T9SS type A sorting domain-containing protein [Bacteroidales bacterium]
MRKSIAFFSLFLFVFAGQGRAQVIFFGKPVRIPPPICYGLPVDAHTRILPRPEMISRLKSSSVRKADIRVTYHDFPSAAKTAFDYAVSLWASMISSPVPIRIDATWEKLPSGVLGSTGPSVYYRGFDGSSDVFKFFPVVLAERMLGRDINGEDQPDIYGSFSNELSLWYFGTDGNCPSGKYDFVTTVLHELCHGLGFVRSFTYYSATKEGDYGLGTTGIPAIFDKYVMNIYGIYLTDTNYYPRPSALLGAALRSDKVYFDGVVTRNANAGFNVKLYAPSRWDQGSSIAHLDDSKYDGTVNGLMTHATQTMEVIHDPGPIALGILGDLGWIHTWIRHDTLSDIEDLTSRVTVKAVITGDTAVSRSSMKLYFSADTFRTSTVQSLVPTGNPNEYAADIPLTRLEQRIFYYISVKDTFGRLFTAPSGAPDFVYSFYVGEDTVKPYIQHQPVPYVLDVADSIILDAVVRDNLGVDTAFIEYLVNKSPRPPIGLRHDSLVYFSASIPVRLAGITADDTIFYRIVARDKSKAHNETHLPATGYFVLQVEPVPEPVRTYHNDFNTETFDFLLNGFSITQPSGFYTPGLHSEHPYRSPDMDNQKLNFTAQLRIPVVLTGPATYMSFLEVVLVEPGEENSAFGSSDFYDYVVVEGSKDGGSTWKPFVPGWDCRAYPEWLAQYNSLKDARGNSLAVGDMSLYKTRIINLLSDPYFQPEDTVLIRFRLFSDPYAHGWGWAIDNIHIQDYVAVPSVPVTQENLSVFPNPASDILNVNIKGLSTRDKITITVVNILGQVQWSETLSGIQNDLALKIPVHQWKEGMYLMTLSAGSGNVSRRIIISH